jgi:ribosomal protein L17
LTTRYAIEKLVREILPRLEDTKNNYTKVERLTKRRRGDNALMGYIEIIGK